MLARAQRLTRQEFTQYFKSGKRFHSPLGTVVYTKSPEKKGAVVVSKKVSKKAVDRNTLRRRVYDILGRFWVETNETGIYIVLLKPEAKRLSRVALATLVREELGRVHKGG